MLKNINVHLKLPKIPMGHTQQHIAIIDPVHPLLMEQLDRLNVTYTYVPEATIDEIKALIPNATGLVVRSKVRVDRELLGTHGLHFVARAGSGVDNLDMHLMTERNITVLNAPEGNRNAVAEHTLAMILDLATNLRKGHQEISEGIWDREGNRGFEVEGKTVGIIGYGNCGTAVAKKLQGFETKVLAYDKYRQNYADDYAEESSMEEILEEADIITFHVPLTAETRGMINLDLINSFGKPVVLINAARGGIMISGDVVAGLESGKIMAAGLDVLENEKIDSWNDQEKIVYQKLMDHKRVILTPHVGGWTKESYRKISAVLAEKITHFLKGTSSDANEVNEFAVKV